MATVTKSIAAEGALDALPTEPPARHAGAYTIVAPIAAGGGGTVWLARDERSGNPPRMVAVKFLHPDIASAPASRRRFLREAEFAASIHHPNVVEVVEVGEASGHPYLVMPFVAGTTVRQLLRRGQLPIDAVLAMVSDALRGLTAAHELRGADGAPLELVHRDISPHNLLVAIDGTTKLTDFGIARPALDAGVSTTRWAQGKVSYFSPEQGRGEPLDRRSDLFAMGIILWECLTGRSLFRADDPFVVAHRVQTMRVPAPSTVR
ncbi:MAG: Serine/threonine protein kinase PrkC, regulator of stationary phase, partial [Myxococcaceae bacterium]|nr:Serine/threonine protein kinase PrkC, regulator of stationary phase [Myxococcaceae bacterium]